MSMFKNKKTSFQEQHDGNEHSPKHSYKESDDESLISSHGARTISETLEHKLLEKAHHHETSVVLKTSLQDVDAIPEDRQPSEDNQLVQKSSQQQEPVQKSSLEAEHVQKSSLEAIPEEKSSLEPISEEKSSLEAKPVKKSSLETEHLQKSSSEQIPGEKSSLEPISGEKSSLETKPEQKSSLEVEPVQKSSLEAELAQKSSLEPIPGEKSSLEPISGEKSSEAKPVKKSLLDGVQKSPLEAMPVQKSLLEPIAEEKSSPMDLEETARRLSVAPISLPMQRYSRTIHEQQLPNFRLESGQKTVSELSKFFKMKEKMFPDSEKLKKKSKEELPEVSSKTGEQDVLVTKFSATTKESSERKKKLEDEDMGSLKEDFKPGGVSFEDLDLYEYDYDREEKVPSKGMRFEYGRTPNACERFLNVEDYSKIFVDELTETALSKGRDFKQQSLIKVVEGITYATGSATSVASSASLATYVCVLEWPTIGEFTIEVGISKIEEFVSYWKFEEDWKYCVYFLKGESDAACDFYRYEAVFSIPCKQYPIAQATASVYFTFEVSRVRSKHCLADLYYTFEGQRHQHKPGIFTFQEGRLFNIIDAKLKFYKTLTF